MSNYFLKDIDKDNLYGKDHASFRKQVLFTVLDNIEQKYISLFRFEGDPLLTLAIQRQLFKGAFHNGASSITDISKVITSKMYSTLSSDMVLNDKIDKAIAQEIKSKDYATRYPLYASPIYYDFVENIEEAMGFSVPRNNKGRLALKIDSSNSAFLKYNHTSYTGLARWIAYAYLYAENQVIYKKRLSLIDAKFGLNNANNSYANSQFDDIYNSDISFVNLSPAQASALSDSGVNDISLDKIISNKLFKINFAEGETLLDIIESFKANKNNWYWTNGESININTKGERNTSGEIEDDKIHFELMKNEFRDQCEMFIQQYKKVFGIQLTLIDMEEKIKDEMLEKQAKLAGRNEGENEPSKD